MDKLSGLASKLGGGSSSSSKPAGGSSGNEDYLDKGTSSQHCVLTECQLTINLALDAAEKKFGHSASRETNEKITDTAREKFESATGYVHRQDTSESII